LERGCFCCCFLKAVKRKIKSFRSVSESLFFACAKVFNDRMVGQSNQKKAHPACAPYVRGRGPLGRRDFSTGHPCPVEKLGHPCPSSCGFFPLAPPLRRMGTQKQKSNNKTNNNSKINNRTNNSLKTHTPNSHTPCARSGCRRAGNMARRCGCYRVD